MNQKDLNPPKTFLNPKTHRIQQPPKKKKEQKQNKNRIKNE